MGGMQRRIEAVEIELQAAVQAALGSLREAAELGTTADVLHDGGTITLDQVDLAAVLRLARATYYGLAAENGGGVLDALAAIRVTADNVAGQLVGGRARGVAWAIAVAATSAGEMMQGHRWDDLRELDWGGAFDAAARWGAEYEREYERNGAPLTLGEFWHCCQVAVDHHLRAPVTCQYASEYDPPGMQRSPNTLWDILGLVGRALVLASTWYGCPLRQPRVAPSTDPVDLGSLPISVARGGGR